MIAPVAAKKSPTVNRIAKMAPSCPPIEEERDARESISFELTAYRMGIELHGYLDIEDVPRWLGLVAREVWISLPGDQEALADRYVGRLVKAAPQDISNAVALKLYNEFILETLRSVKGVCKAHAATTVLLDWACCLLETQPDSNEWDNVKEAAFAIESKHANGSSLRSAAITIGVAAERDSYSPLWSWSHAQDALGNRKFKEPDGHIRRSTESLKGLSRRVFRIIKEGHARKKAGAKRKGVAA